MTGARPGRDSEAMRPVRNRYVDVQAGQVHLREIAGAGAPILLLHQTASSSACYLPLMRALTLPNRLIAMDTPGFGGSFDPAGAPSIEDYAAVMLDVLDELQAGPVHVFGHHTGATLALALAAQAPERVRSVMLGGPVLMTAAERAAFAAHYNQPIAPRRDGKHLQTNWDYAAAFNPDCSVELLHDEVVAMLRAWRGRPQAYSAVARYDEAATARGVTHPVLLLTSPDDFFHAHFDRATALFPNAHVAVTAGGNFQPTADPAGVARAVEHFVADLPG